MKKGFIPLLLSLVLGGFALYSLLRGRFHFVYLPMRVEFSGFMLEVPRLTVSPNVIMTVLGVAVNLFAMIFLMPSLAVGAAVFYGMSIGFAPESYPYVILELALCLFAAMRMKVRSGGRKSDPLEPEHIHYSEDMNRAGGNLNGGNLSGGKRDIGSGNSWFVLKSDDDLGRVGSARKNSDVWIAFLFFGSLAIGVMAALFSDSSRNSAPDLTGSWQMEQAAEGSTSMNARIDDDTIKVYWQTQDNQSIPYWTGTFVPPKDDTVPYTWVSENKMDQDSGSAFAAKDSTKTFLYDGDALRFTVSDMGTVKMSVSLYRGDR